MHDGACDSGSGQYKGYVGIIKDATESTAEWSCTPAVRPSQWIARDSPSYRECLHDQPGTHALTLSLPHGELVVIKLIEVSGQLT